MRENIISQKNIKIIKNELTIKVQKNKIKKENEIETNKKLKKLKDWNIGSRGKKKNKSKI